MKAPTRKICIALLITLAFSCNQGKEANPFNQMTDDELKIIMIKAVGYAGGIDRWKQVESISFTKKAVYYLPEGTIDVALTQQQSFKIHPTLNAMFKWEQAGNQVTLSYENGMAVKTINGQIQNANPFDIEQVLGDFLVLAIPFSLLENASNLEMVGELAFDDQEAVVVHSINHRLNPVNDWWYFFNEETGEYLASTVHHSPTYAHIKNEEFQNVEGLKFPAHRRSFRTDSLGNIEYLRAEFFYSDYKIRLR